MQVNQSLLTLVPLSLGMQPLDKPSASPSFHPARGHSHNTPNPQAAIHPTLAGRRRGGKTKQKKLSWVSPTCQRPKTLGQITSRDLLRAAGPSLHRPQSFPAPPAAHRHANRQIHYAVFVCVRACRLQAADSQTPSQPRPPALVSSQISLPPLPSPASLRRSSNSVARRLPARRQRAAPELISPRRPTT